MSLASPERLIWLAAAIPIIAFYLLKTRLRREPVATLRFWDDVSERKRRRSISLRLRHWLSLLVQLAILLLLVAALVDPLRSGQDKGSRQWVLIMDASASMRAKLSANEQRSRWEAAVEAALRQVESARPGDELALIAAGSDVEVVSGMTDFPPVIREAIARLHVTDGPTDLQEAIAIARRLAPDPARRTVVVFTDGGGPAFSGEEAAEETGDIERVVVGEAVDNVAITQMQTRRSFVDPIEYSVLVRWSNFGDQPATGRLVLRHDDDLLDAYPVDLAPNETRQETFQYASTEGGIVTAELQIDDSLPLDNLAQAILSKRERIAVSLVTDDDDPFLRGVLSAMPDVDLTVTDQWFPHRDQGQLTVLHHVVPDPLPEGPRLMIAPRADSSLWSLQPELPETIISEQADSSLLLSNVALENTPVSRVTPLALSTSATPLLKSAEGATVMASIDQPSGRTVILAADLVDSDLPLRIAFPVIMTNAVRWLTNADVEQKSAIATGDTAELPAELVQPFFAMNAVNDAAPGFGVPIVLDGDTALAGPFPYVGIYHAVAEPAATDVARANPNGSTTDGITPMPKQRDLSFAVNLTNPGESDLRPRVDRGEIRQASDRPGGGRPPWFYLTLAAFGLIVGEWYLFQRRIVA